MYVVCECSCNEIETLKMQYWRINTCRCVDLKYDFFLKCNLETTKAQFLSCKTERLGTKCSSILKRQIDELEKCFGGYHRMVL